MSIPKIILYLIGGIVFSLGAYLILHAYRTNVPGPYGKLDLTGGSQVFAGAGAGFMGLGTTIMAATAAIP